LHRIAEANHSIKKAGRYHSQTDDPVLLLSSKHICFVKFQEASDCFRIEDRSFG
jgi:hypothetical protein